MAITLACGLAVARGIRQACGQTCDIRWPNDVLINGKKCCGILVDLVSADTSALYVIVGIGVNVNQKHFPAELDQIATSLSRETGREWARDIVFNAILGELQRYYDRFLEQGSSAIVAAFTRASSYAKGRRVEINSETQTVVGVTVGLDERGILLVRKDDGEVVEVIAGGVRPLEE
jgi:BirA family biotin operon repressor/biotin-[acetyl-CoA-carboxylase] ligase